VQKFEPGVEAVFHALTETLEKATEMPPPVIYIRIDDDLSWREVS
jgi:crossover junction endodeoxyribonuclease RusA